MWRNRQTRWIQVPVVATPCGFKSHHPHQNAIGKPFFPVAFFYCVRFDALDFFIDERRQIQCVK